MKPVQEQEQNQQQPRTGREPFEHIELPFNAPRSREQVSGKFPKLTTTLRAAVLAAMLAGDDVSGMESFFSPRSTKLATVIRALTRRYRWPIERQEYATNMADGRVAWVSMYTLPAEVITSAFDLGAEAWLAEVSAARLKRLRRNR